MYYRQYFSKAMLIVPLLNVVLVASFSHADATPFCYRLDDHLSEVTVMQHSAPDPSFSSPVPIWPDPAYKNRDLERKSVTVEKEVIQWSPSKARGLTLHDALDVYAPDFDALEITVAVEGVSELIFSWRFSLKHWIEMEYHDYCFFKLPVVADGQKHSYTVRLDNMDQWSRPDIVDGFRIKTEAPAEIKIHKIELRKKSSTFANLPVGSKQFYTAGEFRQVVYAYTPAAIQYRLKLPANPVFVTGLNFVEQHEPVTFEASISCIGNTVTLFKETLENNHQWVDIKKDLSAYAGQEVDITLRAVSDAPGQTVLWSNLCVYEKTPESRETRKPNILVYLVDALRADHLDAYGYDRPVAPFINQWSKTGSLFQECRSHETCTKASMMSFHSGIDSAAHRYTCSAGVDFKNEPVFFPALLRQQGYETAVISQNNYSPPLSPSQKQFSKQVQVNPIERNTVCKITEKRAFEFLESHQDRPFYLYLHTMEVHDTMKPRPGRCPVDDEAYKAIWEVAHNDALPVRYDASIAYADYNFRRLHKKLEDLNLLDNTIIIFTADHGDALGDHGLDGHSYEPYEHQIHIPLIMSGPGIPVAKFKEEVTLTDLSVSLLAMAGIAAPAGYPGRNLLSLFNGGEFQARPTFSFLAWRQENASVVQDGWKYMRFETKDEKLFSLAADPGELTDLSESNPEKTETMRILLEQHVQAQEQVFNSLEVRDSDEESPIAVDPAELEILKALGYID